MKVNKSIVRVMGISLLILMVIGCKEEESSLEKLTRQEDERIKKYLADKDIVATRDPSGFYYEVLKENAEGQTIKTNDILSVFYNMQTLEGKQLEKTTDSLAPIKFLHNYKSIVPVGLDYGADLMKEGEKFRFYLPSTLAYGDYNADEFAPNSIFIVDLEVVNILSQNEQNALELDSLTRTIDEAPLPSGLIYQQLEKGSGVQPKEYDVVKLLYKCTYLDSTLVDKTSANPITVTLREENMIKGLREGIKKMEKGGKAIIAMPSKLAFGGSVQVLPTTVRKQLIDDQILLTRVLPFSPLVYEIELVDVN